MTCTHFHQKTGDGGYCAINAYGKGVMVGPKVCARCTKYSGPPRLGDRIEAFAKPYAKALKLDCLDEKDELKPESPCGKRRAAANEIEAKAARFLQGLKATKKKVQT